MNYARHVVSTASIVGVEGRRLFIFIENYSGDDSRFAFTLNGEPVRATQTAVHKQGIARGLNLIANGTFGGNGFPWRAGGENESTSGLNAVAAMDACRGRHGLSFNAQRKIRLH